MDGRCGTYHAFLNDVGIPRPLGDSVEFHDLLFRLDHPVGQCPFPSDIRHSRQPGSNEQVAFSSKRDLRFSHLRELCVDGLHDALKEVTEGNLTIEDGGELAVEDVKGHVVILRLLLDAVGGGGARDGWQGV